MKRKIYDYLLNWKNKKDNLKPLILLGARQVGKTYIISEFCKNEFEKFVEVNLFDRVDIVNLYNMELTSEQKFNRLKVLIDCDLEDDNTVLFIDEIQESERLISELKFFCEKHNKVRIICAGALLGVKLKRKKVSFPVGKVDMVTMYPMDFEEFLIANNQELLISEIRNCYKKNIQMVEPIHKKALEYFKYYLISGGMPESVQNMVNVNCDIIKYDGKIKNNIISSYFEDMKRYVENNSEALKIKKTYNSIPSQLANDSNKFQFSKIEKNARSREYESCLDWLSASELIGISYRVTNPQIPLEGYKDNDSFKIFMNDVGLLIENLKIKYADIMMDNLSLYKGAMIENYVANQLVCNDYSLYYWESSATAEVDFLLYTNDGIIPVEVKAGNAVKSKSLNVYIDKYNPKYAIRISTRNFGYSEDKKIKSIPLYAVFCLKD